MDRRTRSPLIASAVAAALISMNPAAAGPNLHASPAKPSTHAGSVAPAMSEAAKIEALISSIEHLQGAVFIRNGSEYDAGKAAAHLRRKLDYAGKRVKTAEQFIDKLATGSSMTGKPYTIRFANGRTVESAAYFREQLKRLEMAPARKTAQG